MAYGSNLVLHPVLKKDSFPARGCFLPLAFWPFVRQGVALEGSSAEHPGLLHAPRQMAVSVNWWSYL